MQHTSSNETTVREQPFQERDDTLLRRIGQMGMHALDGLYGRFSTVGDRPVHDPARFEWTSLLEDNWTVMREEADEILRHREVLPSFHDIAEDASTISQDDRWKTLFLYGYGEKIEENCARCPRTTELIEQVPGMTTAFFSILSPGKHIPPHRGPYKGVLRYHLGLKVPEPAEQCRIRVADQVEHWEEGESLVFDDTYDHEVRNATDGERVILFLDVKRPMRQPMAALNDLVLSLLRYTPVIQEARENQRRWAARLERAEAQPA
ncbi:MAG: aspartyl/asparaginyl beta-hydroxylase domain-containing protein [Salinibacter sp.]